MENLTEQHKNILRELVRLVNEGKIPEEFLILWRIDGAILVCKNPKEFLETDSITKLSLDALTQAGLLLSHADMESRASAFGSQVTTHQTESSRNCVITPKGYRAVATNFSPTPDILLQRPPVSISESLAKFKIDYPDPSCLAFVMMQFSKGPAHNAILSGIRNALQTHGLIALRADDKAYNDDLFPNIQTYIYGCRFGIAVFERIESETINPNVSLEVGYMLGLGKSVCFLKDKTQKTLQTDLIGKLYVEFDPHDAANSIPQALFPWFDNKGFIIRRAAQQTTTPPTSSAPRP